MAKERKDIPKATKEKVLVEFNHRCAICGTGRPQIHHIDEDPSNNDPTNLIPLCPNCHLIDHHNPTAPIDPKKLKIFREYKDPLILSPQFEPWFRRLRFFVEIHDLDDGQFDTAQTRLLAKELIDFVAELEKGAFYSKKNQQPCQKTFVSDGALRNDFRQ